MSPWTTPDPPIYGGPQHPFPMNAPSRDTDALAKRVDALEARVRELEAAAERMRRVDYRNML